MAHQRKTGVIRLIGVFRLLKGAALIAVGVGALNLVGEDLAGQTRKWLEHFQMDPNSHYARTLISKAFNVKSDNLVLISVATFFYAALFLVEGVGLLMVKRWAEWFTVFVTASFIPLEIYHLVKQFSAFKIVVIILNVAILVYLIWRLKTEKSRP